MTTPVLPLFRPKVTWLNNMTVLEFSTKWIFLNVPWKLSLHKMLISREGLILCMANFPLKLLSSGRTPSFHHTHYYENYLGGIQSPQKLHTFADCANIYLGSEWKDRTSHTENGEMPLLVQFLSTEGCWLLAHSFTENKEINDLEKLE